MVVKVEHQFPKVGDDIAILSVLPLVVLIEKNYYYIYGLVNIFHQNYSITFFHF